MTANVKFEYNKELFDDDTKAEEFKKELRQILEEYYKEIEDGKK